MRVLRRHHLVHERPDARRVHQREHPRVLVTRTAERADDLDLVEVDPVQPRGRHVPRGRAGDDDRSAVAHAPQRMRPGRPADAVDDRVHLLRQLGVALEHLMGAEPLGQVPLVGGAAHGVDPESGRRAQLDQRGGQTTRGALHEHGVPGEQLGLGEQHPVRGQPRAHQAGGLLPREVVRDRQQAVGGRGDVLGERSRACPDELRGRQDERLVGRAGRGVQYGVERHPAAVRILAGGLAAQDPRVLVVVQPDAPQGPQILVVEGDGPDPDAYPALGDHGVRAFADDQRGERVVVVRAGCVDGFHTYALSRRA
ncbi:hypothetical protein STANM309S_00623 [Streptomyces tanashiensis]